MGDYVDLIVQLFLYANHLLSPVPKKLLLYFIFILRVNYPLFSELLKSLGVVDLLGCISH